jgi:hypothetical protein
VLEPAWADDDIHLLTWPPFTTGTCACGARPVKGVLFLSRCGRNGGAGEEDVRAPDQGSSTAMGGVALVLTA